MISVGWVDIKDPHTGKLLLKFHPMRDIIEVQRRGIKTVVDLTSYRVTNETQKGSDEGTLHTSSRCT